LTVRGRRVVAAAVVLAVVAAVTVLLARQPTKPKAVSSSEALVAAQDACAAADELQRLVERNARLDEVRRALRRAEDAADTAARGDARWQALDGGVKSVRIGIEANDERVTRTGITVVRAECRRLG
jgi:hypothetical protein